MGNKITYSQLIQDAISEDPQTQFPIAEFAEYKTICLEEGKIPAPTETEQHEYMSYAETIGRDKFFTRPIAAREEDLFHAHTWQEGCMWGEGENLRIQWACTSDSYVVYSYFVDRDQDHHIHIIDYCKDKAHELIEDPEQVSIWTEQAKQHRLQNI
jgi:hypothetical protein